MDRFQHFKIKCQTKDIDPKYTSHVGKPHVIHNCLKLLQTRAQFIDLNIIEHTSEELTR